MCPGSRTAAPASLREPGEPLPHTRPPWCAALRPLVPVRGPHSPTSFIGGPPWAGSMHSIRSRAQGVSPGAPKTAQGGGTGRQLLRQRTSLRSWPGWSWHRRAPLGWGSGSCLPLGRRKGCKVGGGRWRGSHASRRQRALGPATSTHRGAWGRWASASRPCGAGAGPARQPRGRAGPGPGPGPGQQPARGLRGGRARWGGVHQGRSPPQEGRTEARGQLHPPSLPTPPPLGWGRALLGRGQAPLPLGGSAWGVEGPCEALGQVVVG